MASSSVAEPPHVENKAAVLYGIEDLVRDSHHLRCKRGLLLTLPDGFQ